MLTCLQGGGKTAVTDLGGSILTGIDGNPLAVLARQLGIPMHDIDYETVPLYLPNGSQPDAAFDKQVSVHAQPVELVHDLALLLQLLILVSTDCPVSHVPASKHLEIVEMQQAARVTACHCTGNSPSYQRASSPVASCCQTIAFEPCQCACLPLYRKCSSDMYAAG